MEKEIVVNGRKMLYFEEGEGFPFLIIHGWAPRMISVYSFFPLQRVLASQGYRVVLLVLPGFENGEDRPVGWGMQEYLDSILHFTNVLGLEKFFLIGHSLGGTIAIRLAADYPEKVKALVLLAPGILRPVRARFWKWWVFLAGLYGFAMMTKLMSFLLFLGVIVFGGISLALTKTIRLERFTSWVQSRFGKIIKNTEARLGRWRSYQQFLFGKGKIMTAMLKRIVAVEDSISPLLKIENPILIIFGKKDFYYHLFSLLSGKITKHFSKHSIHEIQLMSGIGHNMQRDAPAETANLILNFVKK